MDTLYEFYSSQGQRLPSVQERQGVAGQAGIQNYTGTAEQNTQLLNFLRNQQNSSPTTTPTTPPTNPSITSPANQTIGSQFNFTNPINPQDDEVRRRAEGILSNDPSFSVNESEIRQKKINEAQDRIRALENIYNQQLQRARQEGQGRVGSGSAILASRGLTGSMRGEAIKSGITKQNRQIEQSIDAEKNTAIQSILSEAGNQAVQEAQRQREALQMGAKNYLEFLKGKDERKAGYVSNVAGQFIAQGIDPSTLSRDELNSIAKEIGTDAGSIINTYRQLEIARQAELADQFPTKELSQGEALLVFNPQTGRYEQQGINPKTATPRAGISTGGGATTRDASVSNVNQLRNAGINIETILDTALRGSGGTADERAAARANLLRSDNIVEELARLGVSRLQTTQREQYDRIFTNVLPQLSQAIGVIENSEIQFGNIRNTLRNVARNFGKDSPEYESIKFLLESVNAPIRNQIFGASLTDGEAQAANAFLIDTRKDSREAILNKARGIQATQAFAANRTALMRAGVTQSEIRKMEQAGIVPSYSEFLQQYGVAQQYIPQSIVGGSNNMSGIRGSSAPRNEGATSSGIRFKIVN